MKQSRQIIQLPKINTNASNILSEIRDYIKLRHNLSNITSKNAQIHSKNGTTTNHSSSNHIKFNKDQKNLMHRYKKIREIQAPYREIVSIQKKVFDEIQQLNPLNQPQEPTQYKQRKSRYFRKNNKHSRSIDNAINSKAILSQIKNKKQAINCEQVCYCLNLIPQKSSISNKSTTRFPQKTLSPQKKQKSLDKKPKAKCFLRQIKNARKQSMKGFRYQPWQNNEEQHDFIIY